jgi:hypothetical protein
VIVYSRTLIFANHNLKEVIMNSAKANLLLLDRLSEEAVRAYPEATQSLGQLVGATIRILEKPSEYGVKFSRNVDIKTLVSVKYELLETLTLSGGVRKAVAVMKLFLLASGIEIIDIAVK